MAKYLRPRRGTKTNAIGQNILLKRGEIFLEFPNSDIGAGKGRIIVGDGNTSYSNINSFIEDPSIYCPRFNNSTYETSDYTFDYNESIETINKMNGGSNSTVNINNNIEYIKQALYYEHNSLMAIRDVLSTKASNSTVTSTKAGLIPKFNNSTLNYFRGNGTWATPPNTDTKYTLATTASSGLARMLPSDSTSTTKFLAGDGYWRIPANTTYGLSSSAGGGLIKKIDSTTYRFLRADNTWATPPNANETYTDDYKSANANTIFSSKGAHDFLNELSDVDNTESLFMVFTAHNIGDLTVPPNSLASTWVKSVYQPSSGRQLIGGQIDYELYDRKDIIPVTCILETKNNETGITVALRNKNINTSFTPPMTIVEYYIRTSIT